MKTILKGPFSRDKAELEEMVKHVLKTSTGEILYHPDHIAGVESCLLHIILRAGLFAKNAHSIYFPVHFIVSLLRLRKVKKKEDLKKIILRFFKGYIKSIAFATVYASGYSVVSCYFNPITVGKTYLSSFIFSHGFLLEDPNRWSEMSLWVLGQWFHSHIIYHSKRKRDLGIPHWDKLLFALSFGIFTHLFYSAEETPRKLNFVMKYLCGDNEKSELKDVKQNEKGEENKGQEVN